MKAKCTILFEQHLNKYAENKLQLGVTLCKWYSEQQSYHYTLYVYSGKCEYSPDSESEFMLVNERFDHDAIRYAIQFYDSLYQQLMEKYK